MREIFTLALILGTFIPVHGEEFVFENDMVKWTIGSDGLNKGLLEKSTGDQWLAERPNHFAWIEKAGRTHAGTAVTRNGDLLRITFADSGVRADYRITCRPRYFVVELAALQGEGTESVCLGQIDARITENYGGWINVRWNDRFAVCLMGLSDRIHTGGLRGVVYPEFGMQGQKMAVMAMPKPQFLDVVQEVEHDFKIPTARIGGQWAKRSDDVRRGYLFTDLTEANVEETIRHARLGEFGYVMTYSGTWSTSLGSYPINLKNFPRGEESLKATIDRCHAAGLKVGMHMLTSFVGKNDPLVRPKPDPRLLKDAEAVLAAGVDAKTREIPSADPLDDFPSEAAFYGAAKQGFDVVIDDEIIHYRRIGGPGSKTLLECARGHLGTTAAPHKTGATIHHLSERYGCYLVDLKTSLKDEVAERIAGLIDRCGFDMIYFDGGECNAANGPYWYWVGQQQSAIFQRVRRDLFVQGSGGTAWTWHFFTRGCCDDFAAVAPKQYLDYHKIADSWQHYTRSFMPAELGWWGFLDDTPDHPATSPDEVELYAVRMLALDSPVSLETNLAALKKHGRTEELLKLLARYERLRLGNTVPATIREKLRQGEWHMTQIDGKPAFCPVRYDGYRVTAPGPVSVVNTLAAGPLKFRLQAVPTTAAIGDGANVVLLASDPPVELKLPEAKDPMPGALAGRLRFDRPRQQRVSVFSVGSEATLAGAAEGKAIDLLKHRALAVKLRVDCPPPDGEPVAVLNVQLESGAQTYRDHYIDLDFTGEKTILIPEPTSQRMLPEFRPAHAAYQFKAAGYHFRYQEIVGLNFRWMRLPEDKPVRCSIELVEALVESETSVKRPEIALGTARLVLPVELSTGDYAEYWANGPVRVFDRNGVLLKTTEPAGNTPLLPAGESRLDLTAEAGGPMKLTVITLGQPLRR